MKMMKIMATLIVLILGVSSFRLFWHSNKNPDTHFTQESISSTGSASPAAAISQDVATVDANTIDADRVMQMKTEYALLEQARKTLKRRLSRLKHHLWDMKFSSEDAKQASDSLLYAYKLLKNPDQLGAFSNVVMIADERAKIRFASKGLDGVDQLIVAYEQPDKQQ